MVCFSNCFLLAICTAMHDLEKKKCSFHWNILCTYHFLGAVKGLYFRNFFRHRITSVHRWHRPYTGSAVISLVFFEFLLCLYAVVFWYFCPFLRLLPFRLLVFFSYEAIVRRKRKCTVNVPEQFHNFFSATFPKIGAEHSCTSPKSMPSKNFMCGK